MAKREPVTIKFLTINIWNRQGPWDQRCELLRRAIGELDPDVIGLQEVMKGPTPEGDGEHSLAEDVLRDLSMYRVFGSAKKHPGDVHFGNTAAARWPIQLHELVPLPSAGTTESRSLLMTEVSTPYGPLPFCVTHLAWRFHHGFVREQQVLTIAKAFKKHLPLRDDALPPVLLGDFNAAPDATEMRFLRGLHTLEGKSIYLADCFEIAGSGTGYTFDARHNPFAQWTHEPPRRIDYVFVRGPDKHGRGIPIKAEVVLSECVDGVTASDHYGVYAEIEM